MAIAILSIDKLHFIHGIVHIIVGRNNVNGEFWAIVSNEPTTLHTFAEYGFRFDIEENLAGSGLKLLAFMVGR